MERIYRRFVKGILGQIQGGISKTIFEEFSKISKGRIFEGNFGRILEEVCGRLSKEILGDFLVELGAFDFLKESRKAFLK